MRNLPAKFLLIRRRVLVFVGSLLLVATGCARPSPTRSERSPAGSEAGHAEREWVSLFDGESLDGWRASEHPETFSVEDGKIVVDGPRAHLFYVGPVQNHDFDDFAFKADVMTMPRANSGIYFHTQYQEEGWPAAGYEVQVNNSYDEDPRRTASLYAVDDVRRTPIPDGEWFSIYIRVNGDRIVVRANGETMVEYTEPKNPQRPSDMAGRVLSSGTFALQAHDPESTVYYKNIRVRPLD
jgi:hypothetical protein